MALVVLATLLLGLISGIDTVGHFTEDELVIPQFEILPAPWTYYDPRSKQPVSLSCRAWPTAPFSSVSYYTASRMTTLRGHEAITTLHQVPLYPVRNSLLTNESGGTTMRVSSPNEQTWLSEQDIHCVASTRFGSILSPPFRSIPAGMDDISLLNPRENMTVVPVPKDNVAVVRCHVPRSRPSALVHFKRDGTLLTPDFWKYLVVNSFTPDKVDLLIAAFDENDQGVYQCSATNPITQQTWTDPRSYRLELRNSHNGSPETRLVRGLSEHRELVVDEGSNVTLYCVFETWPVEPTIVERVDQVQTDHKRHSSNSRFGTLKLNRVDFGDEGLYRCVVKNVTSTVILRVKRQPRVVLSPSFISVPKGASVTLNCSSSGPSIPLWYFNGRIKRSQQSLGFDSQLFLPSVDVFNTGVYQCVVRDSDHHWISGQSVVSLDSQHPIQRTDYSELMQPLQSVGSWHTNVSLTLSNRQLTLSCLPPEPYLGELTHLLSGRLPGQTSLLSKLRLARQFGFIIVEWLKDGVQLKLPRPPSGLAGLFQLNLTVTRSVDFGSYRCVVWTSARHLLFSHETRVKRLSHWNGLIVAAASPESSAQSTRLKAAYFATDSTPIGIPMDNATDVFDPNDRGKRNALLSNQAPSPKLGQLLQTGLSNDGEVILAYADQAKPTAMSRAALDGSHPSRPVSATFRLPRPNASTVGDNLAARISWPAVQVDFYQVLFRTRLPMDPGWSEPFYTDEKVAECCIQHPTCCQQTRHIYLTNRQRDGLEPGHLYEFRIRAFIDQAVIGKSPWSNTISFEHISKVAPVITETERLSDGGMLARWTLATSAVGFPIDHFLLLYRPETRLANGKITYEGFQTVFVPNGATRECKLRDLEPGKGYQIVVYGVHTPPGMDAQMSIFKGGLGGRRITQFSHEIFVKPRDSVNDAGGDSAWKTAHGRGGKPTSDIRDSSLALNSTESNRLMFLILGALAGLMILIMICLVILCFWRQQRDKKRLLLYCNNTDADGTKSVDGYAEQTLSQQQQQSSRPLPGSGKFMLSHLNTLETGNRTNTDTHRSRKLSQRSSMIYPQPPPMSPPPPPPSSALVNPHACIRPDEALEMASLMSDYAQRQLQCPPAFHDAQPYAPPLPSTGNGRFGVEPYPVYWAAQHAQLNMTGSKYSGHFVPINYYPSNSTLPNVPYELKREPPSGGSVHDGTDTECDMLDQGISMGHNEPILRPRNPLSPTSNMHGVPMHPNAFTIVPSSYPSGNYQQHHHPIVYGVGSPQQPYCPAAPHCLQSADVDRDHSYPQPYTPCASIMDPSMLVSCSYDPGLGTTLPNLEATHTFDQRMPYTCPENMSRLPGTDYTPRQEKVGSSAQLENRPHHHRRRRRRLTAGSGSSDNPGRDNYLNDETAGTGTPLMSSSPAACDSSHVCHSTLEPCTSDQPPPLPQHHPSYQGTVRPPEAGYPLGTYGHDIPGDRPSNNGSADWTKAYNSPSCPDSRHLSELGYNMPPEVPAHRPYHIPGPLSYGNYNPVATAGTPNATTAPSSLSRRIPVGLLNGPPRVRDYSEYGIPNVHPRVMQSPPPLLPSVKPEHSVHRSMESMDPIQVPYVATPSVVMTNTPDQRFTPLGQTT